MSASSGTREVAALTEEGFHQMRKRLALLTTPIVLGLALMLPATTAASSLGSIKILDQYCVGSTIHAKYQITKNANHYATEMILKLTGQGSYDASHWHNAGSKTYDRNITNPWNYASYTPGYVKFNSTSYPYSRINGTARWYDHGSLLATAHIATGYC